MSYELKDRMLKEKNHFLFYGKMLNSILVIERTWSSNKKSLLK